MFRKYCHAMSFFDGSKVPLKSISMQNKTNVHWTWNMLSSRHLFSKPNNYLLISSTWIFSLADWKYLILPARKTSIFLYIMKMLREYKKNYYILRFFAILYYLQYKTWSTNISHQLLGFLSRSDMIQCICRTKIHKSSFFSFRWIIFFLLIENCLDVIFVNFSAYISL